MLHAFLIEHPGKNSQLIVGTETSPQAEFIATANPVTNGVPQGIIVTNGKYYGEPNNTFPALVVYPDNAAEIREDYPIEVVTSAKYVFAGSKLLVRKGEILPAPSTDTTSLRSGVGVRRDGAIIYILHTCTIEELATAFMALGAVDALMLATKDAYANYKGVELNMTTRPVTVLQAQNVRTLTRPIVVIDPGHGGVNPGAIGFGMQEKHIALRHSLIMHKWLVNNYEGTFLLTRRDDTALSLRERVNLANSVNADLFVSVHSNASAGGTGTGFESFTRLSAPPIVKQYQVAIHTAIATFLTSRNVRDRGQKEENFYVVTNTRMPSILLEFLFINNQTDAQALKDVETYTGMSRAAAEGIARALNLKKIQVTAPTPAPAPVQVFTVQVGTFTDRRNAESQLARLKTAGFDGIIVRK